MATVEGDALDKCVEAFNACDEIKQQQDRIIDAQQKEIAAYKKSLDEAEHPPVTETKTFWAILGGVIGAVLTVFIIGVAK